MKCLVGARNRHLQLRNLRRACSSSASSRNVVEEQEYLSASNLPSEAKVIIYGNELVSKALAHHLADSLGANVIVIRGEGPRPQKFKRYSAHNSFYINHLVVQNPRSSLLIRHSCDMYNVTNCGAVYLAQTEERVRSFKRMISISKLFIPKEYGVIDLLSPEGNSIAFIPQVVNWFIPRD